MAPQVYGRNWWTCDATAIDEAAAVIRRRRYLETDELEDYVWQSYGDTIKKHDIRAIPYFIFGPRTMWSPFRPDGEDEPMHFNIYTEEDPEVDQTEHQEDT